MKEAHISIPELALVAGTRAALGAGLGFLLGDRLPRDQRKAVGWTLLIVGLVTTVPLALDIFGSRQRRRSGDLPQMRLGGPSRSAIAEAPVEPLAAM